MPVIPPALSLFTTGSYDCPYLEGRRARAQVVSPIQLIDTRGYDQLIHGGFRRSGAFIYRPCCDQCSACVGVRIPLNTFHANRSQRRTSRLYKGVTCQAIPLQFHEEHFQLYCTYQSVRHAGSGMDKGGRHQYEQFLLCSKIDSVLLEFREGGRLVMGALTDIFPHGLSAVYTYFDPTMKGLGTFAILSQIELGRTLNKDYLYLGYWIANSAKMAYKIKFRPMEFFVQGCWTGHEENQASSVVPPPYDRDNKGWREPRVVLSPVSEQAK